MSGEKEREERGGRGDFLYLQDPGWKMNMSKGATQSDKNAKQQQNINKAHCGNPLSHLFTLQFPQQKHPHCV